MSVITIRQIFCSFSFLKYLNYDLFLYHTYTLLCRFFQQGVNIYRMKGVLAVKGLSDKYAFQGVHMMLEGAPLEPWGPDQPRTNKLVFIGRKLDRAALEAGFEACLVA
jgi:G3E family GTPase